MGGDQEHSIGSIGRCCAVLIQAASGALKELCISSYRLAPGAYGSALGEVELIEATLL